MYNHAFFTVAALGEHTVALQDDLGAFEIKQEEAAKVLRLTFALTYASIEGMTLPGISGITVLHPHRRQGTCVLMILLVPVGVHEVFRVFLPGAGVHDVFSTV